MVGLGFTLAGFALVIWLLAMFIALGLVGLWLWMLVDCLTRPAASFPHTGEYQRLIWVLVIIFGHGIGALVYLFVVKLAKGTTG